MNKLSLLLPLLLVACSDDKPNVSQAYNQQQQIQPQYQAPVIVNTQPNNSGSNDLANFAAGAVLGHLATNALSNNSTPETIIKEKTVYIDNRVTQQSSVTKPSSMNMSKLTESANYKPPVNLSQNEVKNAIDNSKLSVPVKPTMDMSKLSTKPAAVTLSKSSSKMDMSKLGKK